MTSNAVGSERIASVVGYKITTGNFMKTTPNLPQRIAILAEANTANQATLPTAPVEVTSANQAGQVFGYGSPIYSIMRILKPLQSDGIGGIPVYVYPVAAASGATAKVISIAVTGTATANATHYVKVAGRTQLDGSTYAFTVVKGDTATDIKTKISDAINGVLGAPVTATVDTDVVCTSKFKGATAQGIDIQVVTDGVDVGVTYAVTQTTAGAGVPSIATALDAFGSVWNTIVINGFGAESTVMEALEQFNGIPGENPTGRFQGIIMKPFIALTGSTLENPSTITDARARNLTIAICPAPKSKGLDYEAAANMAVLFAKTTQDNPHLDVQGGVYPDMPTPEDIGLMAKYSERDAIVKKGCSTVDLVNGAYKVEDFVTTYHPVGEVPAQFRYCRNIMLDFNVRYGYYLLEQTHVVGHAIANDMDTVTVGKVIKPKQWKGILKEYALDLTSRALIVDADFLLESLVVNISATNPDRLETAFRYKRSGFLRIASTTAEAGFNFGSN